MVGDDDSLYKDALIESLVSRVDKLEKTLVMIKEKLGRNFTNVNEKFSEHEVRISKLEKVKSSRDDLNDKNYNFMEELLKSRK